MTVYNSPAVVLASFKLLLAQKKISFKKFSWLGARKPPVSKDPYVAITLDITLGSLSDTFAFAHEWAAKKGMVDYLDPEIEKAITNLSLPKGVRFRPWTIRWVKVKRDAYLAQILDTEYKQGRDWWRQEDVSWEEHTYESIGTISSVIKKHRPTELPGCALLFMMAQHPSSKVLRGSGSREFGYLFSGLRTNAYYVKRGKERGILYLRHYGSYSPTLDVHVISDKIPDHLSMPILV